MNETIKRSMTWMACLTFLAIVSNCSDGGDDAEQPEDVKFPEATTMEVGAGEEASLTFTATADWTLTSNASWCRFMDGEFAETAISGKAGNQTVKIRIDADNQDGKEDDVAEITMKMGGKEQVISHITRLHKETVSKLIVKDEEEKVINEDNPLLIKGGNITESVETRVTVEIDDENAQVGVLVERSAAWVNITLAGDSVSTYEISFKEDNVEGKDPKYPVSKEEGSVVTFEARKGDEILATTSIPIYYDGLAEDALVADPAFLKVTVSEDGKEMTDADGEEHGDKLTFTVTTRNDDFGLVEFVPAEYDMMGNQTKQIQFPSNGDLDWVTSSKSEKNQVEITVSELSPETEERKASVMVLPRSVYDRVKGSLDSLLDETTQDIKSAYTTFVVADLVQRKYVEPAPKVRFVGYYYEDGKLQTFDEVKGKWPTLKMEDITGTPEGDAIYEDYGGAGSSTLQNNNIWKVTVPADMLQDENHCLAIEAENMSEGEIFNQTTSEGYENWEKDFIDFTKYYKGEECPLKNSPETKKKVYRICTSEPGKKPTGYQINTLNIENQMISAVCAVEIQ